MDGVFIIWPERKWLSGAALRILFSDAVANGKIEDEYLDAKTDEEMTRALNSAGEITTGKVTD